MLVAWLWDHLLSLQTLRCFEKLGRWAKMAWRWPRWTSKMNKWYKNELLFVYSILFSWVTQLCPIFATPWTAPHQASLSITNSQNLLKLMSIESVTPSDNLILCRRLLLLPLIFPSIRVFSNESVLHISSVPVHFSRSIMSDSVWPHELQPTRLLCPWDSPGKNTGVGCHFLLKMHETEKSKWSPSVVSDS